MDVFDEYYTLEEIAGFLGINVRTLKNRISKGTDHPPVVRGVNKFRKESFAKWLKEREKKQERKVN